MKKAILVALLVTMFLFPVTGVVAAPEVVDKVLVTVNGEMIPLSEFNAVFVPFAMRAGTSASPEDITKARKEIFKQLLENKILLQEAKSRNIQVGKRELESTVENAKKNFGGADAFVEQLKREGMTEEDYREKVKESLMAQRLIGEMVRKDVKVDVKEYQEYYQKNIEKFRELDKVRLSYIFIKTGASFTEDAAKQKADVIIKEINAGLSFAEAAKKYSDAENAKENGGDLGVLKPGELPVFGMEPFKLNSGEISMPVKIPGGIAILKAVEREQGKQLTLSDEILDKDGQKVSIREVAQKMVMEEKLKEKFEEFIKSIKANSVIDVKIDEFK